MRWYPQKSLVYLLVCGRDQQSRYQHAPNRYGNPNSQARRPARQAFRRRRAAIVDHAGRREAMASRLSARRRSKGAGDRRLPGDGLREAREARDEAKEPLGRWPRPRLVKKLAKAAKAAATANTFDAIAAELLEKKRREGKGRKHHRESSNGSWALPGPPSGRGHNRNNRAGNSWRCFAPSKRAGGLKRRRSFARPSAGFSLRRRHRPRRKRPHGRAQGRARHAERSASRRDYRAQGLRRAFTRPRRL